MSGLLPGASALAAPHRHRAATGAAHKPHAAGGDEDGDTTGADGAAMSSPANTPIGPVDTLARWACIIDFTTGAVLMEKAPDERMPPSSLTKMMTAYITFSMLKSGRLHLDQQLPVSEKAWRMQGSKMFVPLGQAVAVQDLIQGMVIQSGNDACIVLAEGISGSEEQFANLMNTEAQRLGLTNTHFMNATGWPAEGHYMSARDVALLACAILRDFPDYYHFFSETEYRFNNIRQGNRNVLVDKGLADGLKTGHTDAGGFGLCASSLRNGNRIVMAINGMPSSNARAHEGERLLGWAFANFENVTLVERGRVVDHVPVWMGASATVGVVTTRDIVLTLPHGWQSRTHFALDYQAPVAAPIAAGAPLAELVITNPGMTDIRMPLVAAHGVEKLGLFARASARLGLHGTAQD
nr:D-alanyl-D-alanine carboxypeptidase family protein [Ameyamaea chiangmaiensis]